jgi:VCBS repeat-containing protein
MKRLVALITVFAACSLLAPALSQAKQGAGGQVEQLKCPSGVHDWWYCEGGSGYELAVLEDEPLGYWRLGDAGDTTEMSDVMGEHPGEYKNGGGGSAQLGVSGEGVTAAYFVGEDQYAFVNGIEAPKGAYSMEAWVRPTDGKAMMIMQQGASGALYINEAGQYTFVPDSNEVHLQLVDEEAEDVAYLHGEAEKFHQVLGTWDGKTDTAVLYVDGREVAHATSTQAPSGSATFYVGYGTLAPWARGYIDEAAYYSHALSAERVKQHFEEDPPPPLLMRKARKSSSSGSSGSSSGQKNGSAGSSHKHKKPAGHKKHKAKAKHSKRKPKKHNKHKGHLKHKKHRAKHSRKGR